MKAAPISSIRSSPPAISAKVWAWALAFAIAFQEFNGNIPVANERGMFCEFTIELPAADSEEIAAGHAKARI
jgi:hypothetical protein